MILCQLDRQTKEVNSLTAFPQKENEDNYSKIFPHVAKAWQLSSFLGTHYAIAYLRKELKEIWMLPDNSQYLRENMK